jgi:hypothetical protein
VSGASLSADDVMFRLRKTELGRAIIERMKVLHPTTYHKRIADRVRTEKKKRKHLKSFMILSGCALISHVKVSRLCYIYISGGKEQQ